MALSNWRVRWRLLALIVIPTLAAVILGGLRISSAASSAVAFKRTEQLAVLNSNVIRLAQSMEDERDLTAGYIASGQPTGTDPLYTALLQPAGRHRRGRPAGHRGREQHRPHAIPPAIRQSLNAVLARISDLDQLRNATTPPNGNIPALPLIQDYTNSIDTLLTFTSMSGTGTSDAQLSNDVITLTALARAEDQASEQRGTLYAALLARQFPPQGLTTLQSAQAQEAAAEQDFQSSASLAEQQLFQNTVSGTPVDQAAFEEQVATSTSNNGSVGIGALPAESTPATWYGNMTFTVGKMRAVESQLVSNIVARSRSLQSSATRSAVITSVITLVLLILVLLITTLVARSMIRPLRRLREDALDIAGTRLPDMVRRLSETEGSDESVEIEPIAVSSTDEIGEVARAFDQVHREAVRLAADEAMLRGNLNAMFVNLSRRSQSLIERQISPHRLPGAGRAGLRPAEQPVPAGPPGHPDAPQLGEPAGSRGSRGVTAVEPARPAGGRAPRGHLRDRAVRAGRAERPAGHHGASARPSTTSCTWSRSWSRTRPRSPPRTPRCTCPGSR